MDSGQWEERPTPRWAWIVGAAVIVAMPVLGLTSHFFGVPPPSPPMSPCEMAASCGAGDAFLYR